MTKGVALVGSYGKAVVRLPPADPSPRSAITAERPDCERCTWSPANGWHIRFINRLCPRHGHELRQR